MPLMTTEKMQAIIEAALMVAGYPLTIAALQNLFTEENKPNSAEIKSALVTIKERYAINSGIELREVASGYRLQTKTELSPWLTKLLEERAPRYSRALLETIAIIAYKQPITRAEIEEIRGVTVSTSIIKTLLEREWVKMIGYRDIPGRPAIYGTTKEFLDYFNLKSLSELPTLSQLKNFEAKEEKLTQMQLVMNETHLSPLDSEAIQEEREAFIENNIIPLKETSELIDKRDKTSE